MKDEYYWIKLLINYNLGRIKNHFSYAMIYHRFHNVTHYPAPISAHQHLVSVIIDKKDQENGKENNRKKEKFLKIKNTLINIYWLSQKNIIVINFAHQWCDITDVPNFVHSNNRMEVWKGLNMKCSVIKNDFTLYYTTIVIFYDKIWKDRLRSLWFLHWEFPVIKMYLLLI